MKIKMELEGELYDDYSEMKIFLLAPDMLNAINEAKHKIRQRIKNGTDQEMEYVKFLIDISMLLTLDGLE